MEKEDESIRSHFVPECYLKQFTFIDKGNSNKLFVCKREHIQKSIPKNFRQASPRQICFRQDLYKINKNKLPQPVIVDTEEQYIEKNAFKDYEDNWEGILSNLVCGSMKDFFYLSSGDAALLINAIISFKRRGIYSYEGLHIKDRLKVSTRQFKDSLLANPRSLKLGLKRLNTSKGKYLKELDAKAEDLEYLKQLSNLLLLEDKKGAPTEFNKLINKLFKKQWYLLKNETSIPFVASDAPGFCIDNSGELQEKYFYDGFVFCFPISPTLCIIIKDEEELSPIELNVSYRKILVINALPDEIQFINRGALHIAFEEIYSGNKEALIQIAEDFKETYNYY